MAKSSRPWFYHFGNRVLRLVFRVVLRVDIRGLDRVPREGPLIIAISHSSFLDPLLAGAYVPRDVTPMAKIEAFSIPVIGLVVRLYGAFPVRRGEVDLAAFKTALQILQNGSAMVIAPEGHRSENGALQQGREGAIMLSLRSGAPILPVAVWGGKPLWKNLSRLRRTPMWFYVGEPVIPAATGAKPTRERMRDMSNELMVRIAEMMPPEDRGYYSDLTRYKSQYLQHYVGTGPEQVSVPKQKEVVIR